MSNTHNEVMIDEIIDVTINYRGHKFKEKYPEWLHSKIKKNITPLTTRYMIISIIDFWFKKAEESMTYVEN